MAGITFQEAFDAIIVLRQKYIKKAANYQAAKITANIFDEIYGELIAAQQRCFANSSIPNEILHDRLYSAIAAKHSPNIQAIEKQNKDIEAMSI
jgi:hypothetical protein